MDTKLWTGPVDRSLERHITDRSDLIALLNHAIRQDVSDVIFQAGRPVLASIHGALVALTEYVLQKVQIERVLQWMTGQDSVVARLLAGRDVDHAFNIPDHTERDAFGHPVQHRFRLNATAGYYEGDIGYQAVLRYIPSKPPTPEEVGLPPELMEHIAPHQGAVIIAGETGSGKTTTYAACIRHILEGNTTIVGNVLTYEAPIEFLFGDIPSSCCTIQQQEIPGHLPSFADGIRNSLRRKPGLIVVGELRDADTILAAVEAANTGHPIYATTHANSASLIIRRLSMKFPADQQDQAVVDLLETTRLVISQLLVPKVGGGRLCLREWFLLNDDVVQHVIVGGLQNNARAIRELIDRGEAGRSMAAAVAAALDDGEITTATARVVLKRYGYSSAALLREVG